MKKKICILMTVLMLLVTGCSQKSDPPKQTNTVMPETKVDDQQEKEPEPTPAVPQKDPEPEKKEDSKKIRKKVKEAIDAYEDFIDEYVKFMKKYKKSNYSAKLLSDYMKFLTKRTDYVE